MHLVDANLINRQAALHNINISVLCPINLEQYLGALILDFITGEGELSSTEGTTQGDLSLWQCMPFPLLH